MLVALLPCPASRRSLLPSPTVRVVFPPVKADISIVSLPLPAVSVRFCTSVRTSEATTVLVPSVIVRVVSP